MEISSKIDKDGSPGKSGEVGFFSGINMNYEGILFSNFKIACGSKHENQTNFYKIMELIFVHKKVAKAILNHHWLLHGLKWPILRECNAM